jgi:hypothetical protein
MFSDHSHLNRIYNTQMSSKKENLKGLKIKEYTSKYDKGQ